MAENRCVHQPPDPVVKDRVRRAAIQRIRLTPNFVADARSGAYPLAAAGRRRERGRGAAPRALVPEDGETIELKPTRTSLVTGRTPHRTSRLQFPISALPGFLTWFAKILLRTHGLALVRYGLLGDSSGLHNIWSTQSTTLTATLSLAVVGVFAAA
jgi:hypothetical protein